MCGITGIHNFNTHEPVDKTLLLQMRDTMRHRGPDETGFYLKGNIGLGHRRLRIIDLTRGQQPLCNEDGTVRIVYNGEVFNHDELRQALIKQGHFFKSRCDTEVIVHLYEEYGLDCVQRLRGQFAFAIWDERQERLMLARDRVGILPLSYCVDNGRLLFASEIKAILQDKRISREIDLEALADYLTYDYVPSPKTIFQQIRKLAPAHILVCERKNISIHRYWTLKYQPNHGMNEAEFTERIHDKLKESVRIRLMSDVPLGAFLSGGIDSSAVVAFMSQIMDQPVKTFSIGFEEQDYDELRYARLVAEHFSTDHREFIVTAKTKESLPRLVRQFDEPFADQAAIPNYYLAKMAREHVTVCLSGDGGDEVFAGYHRYRKALSYSRRLIYVAPTAIRFPIFNLLGCLFPKRTRSALRASAGSSAELYGLIQGCVHPSERNPLLSDEVKAALSDERPYERMQCLYEEATSVDCLSCIQYIDTMSYLPDDILVKVDRTGLANSLETRVPLLDYQLLELMATTPADLRMRGLEQKYVLKQILRDLLPDEILNRPKQAFNVPIRNWFEHDWQSYTASVLLDPQAHIRHYFSVDRIQMLLDNYTLDRKHFSRLLYKLLIFEEWARCYLV
jgi:asparagine synthase (glutamine-hydrolysing)